MLLALTCLSRSADLSQLDIRGMYKCKSGSRRESWIVRYLLPIPRQAELNEESVRVRLGQKGCG